MSEKEFQGQVVKAARLLGWMVFHTYDSRHSVQGFPDLCMVRPPRLLFAELKTDAGKIRPEQIPWNDAINSIPGIPCYLWRPKDWERIVEVLR
jgi:hypothetical protein